MENLNLGGGTPVGGGEPSGPDSGKTQPITPMGSETDQPTAGGSKPDSISINFTPKTPDIATDKPKDKIESPTPQVISMDIKRDDLKKETPEALPAPEKKGFLSGFFGKKTETKTKPSSAWNESLDIDKEPQKTAEALKISTPSPTPTTTTIPAADAKPEEKSDFFSSAALQEKAGSSKLMENIVTQKAQLEQPKMEDLLGKKSNILEKTIEQESQLKLKKKLRLMQFMALMVAVAAISINGYLYYQLSPGIDFLGYGKYDFDSNLRNNVFNLNESLKSTQTELNKYRYLSGQLYLDQFGYESTRFIDGVSNLEAPGLAADKNAIQSVITEAKNNMPDLLAGAKQNLSQLISVETYATRGEEEVDPNQVDLEAQRQLRQAISSEKQHLVEASAQSNLELPAGSIAFFNNTLRLVGNNRLLAKLKAKTVNAFQLEAEDYQNSNDPTQRSAFKGYIDDLLASTKVNLATITNLRNARVAWTDVIDRIEQITNKINSDHNSGLGSSNASKIIYSSFDLNSDTGKVTVSGVNTTRSGTNREVVTYLIEAFEASPEFKDVSNRSFPLSKSTDLNGQNVYTLNFKIDMALEVGAFSKLNQPIADLQAQKVAVVKIPVKRNN